MRNRWSIVIIFIITIVVSISFTYLYTSRKYQSIYKIDQWVNQNKIKIISFDAKVDNEKLSIFNSTFNLNISIKGYLKDYGNGYKPYVKHLHFSERVEEKNNELVAYIKITPIVENDLHVQVKDYSEPFSYSHVYKLNTFIPNRVNKYIIQCDNFTKIVEVEQKK